MRLCIRWGLRRSLGLRGWLGLRRGCSPGRLQSYWLGFRLRLDREQLDLKDEGFIGPDRATAGRASLTIG